MSNWTNTRRLWLYRIATLLTTAVLAHLLGGDLLEELLEHSDAWRDAPADVLKDAVRLHLDAAEAEHAAELAGLIAAAAYPCRGQA